MGGEVEPQTMATAEFIEQFRTAHPVHESDGDCELVASEVWDGTITTDLRLLKRVITNMLRNAMEATKSGDRVTLRCCEEGDRVVFLVHNDSVMPEEVQMQLFQRSFSTKADTGRGIGTHSMKLIGERYLHGEVGFTSRAPEGTTFWIKLPKTYPSPLGRLGRAWPEREP